MSDEPNMRCPKCGGSDVWCNGEPGSAHDHGCNSCGHTMRRVTLDQTRPDEFTPIIDHTYAVGLPVVMGERDRLAGFDPHPDVTADLAGARQDIYPQCGRTTHQCAPADFGVLHRCCSRCHPEAWPS